MTFDPNASLDPSQVTDARGGGFGGRGLILGGGGGIGLIFAIAYLLLGGNVADMSGGAGGAGASPAPSGARGQGDRGLPDRGAQANQREDCRIVGYVDSIQKSWSDAFAASNQQYQDARTVL